MLTYKCQANKGHSNPTWGKNDKLAITKEEIFLSSEKVLSFTVTEDDNSATVWLDAEQVQNMADQLLAWVKKNGAPVNKKMTGSL